MTVRFSYALFCLVLFLSFSGCDNEFSSREPSVLLTAYSSCKYLKSSEVQNGWPDSVSAVIYSYSKSEEILSLIHINAGFNCCPEKFLCKVSLNGDTLRLVENEKEALCDCNCLYDLDIEISDVPELDYVVEFIEPYADGMEALVFNIDLSLASEGTFFVYRYNYPWNLPD